MSIWRRLMQVFEPFGTKSTKPTHLSRTADSFRQENMIVGKVDNISRLSPDVKGITIMFPSKVDFKAGQWIDLQMPETVEIGGFSICSAPYEMQENNTMQLAVKFALYTPAEACHKLELNTEVGVRVGGDFFYEPDKDSTTDNILLIAGGVGINPLFSILKQTLHEDEKNDRNRNVRLFYSAKNEMDLLFREEILDLDSLYDNFETRFFVTQGHNLSQNILINTRRINEDDLKSHLGNCQYTKIFICGPRLMMEYVMNIVEKSNFPEENIFFEKWW